MDRVTANLPSPNFDATVAFYGRLGFEPDWRGEDWLILSRGPLEIEFFPHPGLDPAESWFSAAFGWPMVCGCPRWSIPTARCCGALPTTRPESPF